MTRDEAEAVLRRHTCHGGFPGQWVDAFVELGMLKLEEPQSARERAMDAIDGNSSVYGKALVEAIEAAGLKIVEK